MTDEMRDRLEEIKDGMIFHPDMRLLDCTLQDMDYIDFLTDQEFKEITEIRKEITTCTSLSKAIHMIDMLLDDIVCYADLIESARKCRLDDMEKSANRPQKNKFANGYGVMLNEQNV